MLYFVSFARRCLSRERTRYWVLERSVWRIDSLRFSVGLLFAGVDARSSMISIFDEFPC